MESLDWSELSLFWTTSPAAGGEDNNNDEQDNRDDDDDDNAFANSANETNESFYDFVVTVGRSRRTQQTFRQERIRQDEMAVVLETLLSRITSINNNCSSSNNNDINNNKQAVVVQQLHVSTDGTVMLPIDCVTSMIQHMKQLQGLHIGRGVTVTVTTTTTSSSLSCCTTKGSSNSSCCSSTDLMLLVQALSHHPTLRTVSLHNLQVNHHQESDSTRTGSNSPDGREQDSVPSVGLLDALIKAISTIPNLECVDLSLEQQEEDDEDEEQQRQAEDELNNLNDFAYAAFTGRRRRRRRQSIRKSTAGRSLHKHQQQWFVSPDALRSLFQTPPRLEQVSLWNWGLTDEHILQGLVPALLKPNETAVAARRSCIQFLSLRQNPAITTTGWKALYQVVEDGHNYTLQYVMSDDLEEEDEDDDYSSLSSSPHNNTILSCHARGKFFLQLNQQDRGELLSQISCCNSTTKWCQVLEQFSHDPAALYYWVQQASPVVF